MRFTLFAVFLLCACTAFDLKDEPVGTEDSNLSVRVKAALIRTLELNAASIDVESVEGEIQLRGFVENNEHKATAEQVATQVKGVKKVVNDIQVK